MFLVRKVLWSRGSNMHSVKLELYKYGAVYSRVVNKIWDLLSYECTMDVFRFAVVNVRPYVRATDKTSSGINTRQFPAWRRYKYLALPSLKSYTDTAKLLRIHRHPMECNIRDKQKPTTAAWLRLLRGNSHMLYTAQFAVTETACGSI